MTDTHVLNWTGVIQPAEQELSAVEIRRRFGALIQSGVRAFRDDPQYLVEVAEDAVRARYQKALKAAKAEVRAEHPGMIAALVTEQAEARVEALGIVCPQSLTRRRAA